MKLQQTDISQTASASSIVYDSLREAIISGELEVGTPLRQDEIAKMFNTSRIPVREAINRLEQQGLAKSQRYKGAVVAGLSRAETNEIYEFRALVEARVIEDAVPRMTQDDLSYAKQCWSDFQASETPSEWGKLNRLFHWALYKPSTLKYHLDVVRNAQDRIDPYTQAHLVLTDGMTKANAEHLAILTACENGDGKRAADLTRQHIFAARDDLLEHLKDRFTD